MSLLSVSSVVQVMRITANGRWCTTIRRRAERSTSRRGAGAGAGAHLELGALLPDALHIGAHDVQALGSIVHALSLNVQNQEHRYSYSR